MQSSRIQFVFSQVYPLLSADSAVRAATTRAKYHRAGAACKRYAKTSVVNGELA